jgi:aspartate ammonia-lyase
MRTEHDLLGDRDVPVDVYYGVHTVRALENFPISGGPISRHSDLVTALASVKQAAAEANQRLGQLETKIADAIIAACVEIRSGSLHDQFVVDEIQGGAGTSTNMNANEMIANRAREILGHARSAYHVVHPLELSQKRIQVVFRPVYFSSACNDRSRPKPLCLKPPKGV